MRSSMVKFLSAAVLIAVIALFPADGLRALGLGEARVDSYLGQPLDVTIRLVEPDGGSLDSLTVAPAVAADYERLGVPSTALALGLTVNVDRRTDPPQIRVTSNQEVVDPVVQVLVDARWSSGRVLREYTLFLDPPTMPVAPPIRRVDDAADATSTPETTSAPSSEPEVSQQQPAPVESTSPPAARPAAPRASDPEPIATPSDSIEESEASSALVQQPQVTPEPAREAVAAAQATTPNSREVGPVEAGQTLWSIAAAWRPSTGLTMNQVMLAILDQNPQAFIDNNVNQLRRDAMLMMPSSDDIAGIDASEAERRMRSQMRAWEPGIVANDVPVISDDAVPEVTADTDSQPSDALDEQIDDTNYRLEVVPPEGESVDDVPAVSEDEIDEATARLAELEDQIQAEGLDNDDLYRQVEDIRDAIEARDLAGLAVANEDLATLESRLREAREARELEAQMADQAQALADETDDAVDEVDEFFNNLEDELGLGEEQSDRIDSGVDPLADEALDADGGITTDQDIPTDQMASDQIADDEAMEEPAASMPVTRTSGDQSWSAWLWTVLVGLAIVLVAAIVFVVKKLRGNDAESSGPSEPAIEVDAARQRVAENPDDLDAHLGLLAALGGADGDHSDQFADALDDMYSVVDDDNDPRWQQALNLAVLNAPDHPLLTPNETGLAEDDTDEGLDEQTREMLGILDKPDNEAEIDFDDPERDGPEEDIELEDTVNVEEEAVDDFFAEVDSDDDSPRSEVESEDADSADDTIVIGDDELDLAALSDRLEEDAGDETEDDKLDAERDSTELSELMEEESGTADFDDVDSVLTDDDPEHPALEASGNSDDLDLDFEFSSIDSLGDDDETVTVGDLDDDLASDINSDDESDLESDADSARDSAGDSEEDHDEDDEDASSPTDTLDLSSQSGSNDTLRMDRDELAALNEASEGDTDADDSDEAGTVRADDTLELVSGEIDFEDMGDRELEAFLAEGDDVIDSDEDEPSILDPGDVESERDGSEEENIEPVDDESADDDDESEPELSDDDAEVKLDLAQAYISMDDRDSARTLLDEIISGGSRAKRKQAQKLLDKL